VFTARYGLNHNIQIRSLRGARQKVMERLDNKQFCALYCSPNFIRKVKSRRMRWERHEIYMGFGKGGIRAFGEET
jgi:hypothetical protein